MQREKYLKLYKKMPDVPLNICVFCQTKKSKKIVDTV